jgi:methylated-DNA-[protein]-cysteine S-methyltransferase
MVMGDEGLSTVVVDTLLGTFGIEATAVGVSRVRLPGDRPGERAPAGGAAGSVAARGATQLEEYARGERDVFDLPLDWAGIDPVHRRVLGLLLEIAPYGHTVTYGELGARAGLLDAREVGVHMNRNPLPIVVPCHRVVASDGLGGYGGGLALKRRLLELEGALPPSLDLGDV